MGKRDNVSASNNISNADKVLRFVAALAAIGGIIILGISAFYEAYSKADGHDLTGLTFLFWGYSMILLAVFLYSNTVMGIKWHITAVTPYSFCACSLFVPYIIVSLILFFTKGPDANRAVIGLICWSIQGIFIGIWFFPKLRRIHTLSEVEIMKLDYYSTIAILGLTIIWVIYDILSIKIGFAIIMGEFLVIQAWIKKNAIDEKERCH